MGISESGAMRSREYRAADGIVRCAAPYVLVTRIPKHDEFEASARNICLRVRIYFVNFANPSFYPSGEAYRPLPTPMNEKKKTFDSSH